MPKKSSTHIEHDANETTQTSRDELATLIRDALNKAQKDGGKVAHFLDEQEDPSMVSDWISTGSTLLDLAISNRPNGGLPAGRIVELNGLESCVTEDTKIEIDISGKIKNVKIKTIKDLLKQNENIKVKCHDGFVKILKYVEKGLLDTYKVVLNNGYSIKVSKNHKFYTTESKIEYQNSKAGKKHLLGNILKFVGVKSNQLIGKKVIMDRWVECQDLEVGKHSMLCDNFEFVGIKSIKPIGKHKIVDISVDHIDQCYFGNGILNHNTGKSLICAHLCAETQKKGGTAVYIDTESAAAPLFWEALGVKIKDLLYIRPVTIEETFEYVENIIAKVRAANKGKLVTIIVDSIAGASTAKEVESDAGVDGFNTAKSIVVGKAMRKLTDIISKQRILLVLTNQLRVNMNAMAFGDKWITPSGKSIPYAASVRVRLASLGKLKKEDDVIGMKCKATVIKNRMGPPYRTAEFEIFFDSGIQDRKSWLDFLKKHKIATSAGGKYNIKLNSGEYKLTSSEFADKLNRDETFKDEVYNTICEKQIMVYRDPAAKIDEDVTEASDEEEEVGTAD